MDLSVHEEQIPIPITNTFASNHGQPPSNHGHGHPPPLHHHHHHHLPYNGPPLPLPPPENHNRHQNQNHLAASAVAKKSAAPLVKYRECLKNHAASIGGNATDGCGEFMPSGEDGTIEALKCSACNCHRNFHRKMSEGDHHQKGLLIQRALPPHHWVMPLGALHSSESDDHEVIMAARPSPSPLMVKKRFRTKFTAEQKEKMLSFAESVGWKLQKLEDGVVQQFCQEIGVKRRVLKVWMHNNKHNFAKKNNSLLDHDQLE